MRVCFVVGKMSFSGAEKVLSIVAKSLVDQGDDVHVLLLQKENGYYSEEENLKIHGVKPSGNKIKRVITRFSNIRKTVKGINPDVVVSFGYVCNNNTIIAMMCSGIPVIACERNDPNYDPLDKTQRVIRKLVYGWAKGYVFQTETISHCFSKKIQQKAAIIPNPIEKSDYTWSDKESNNVIVTVARLDEYQKNLTSLFEAFSVFYASHINYLLEVYGDGPDRALLENKIAELKMTDKIILKGRINNPTSQIVKAKMFVLSSVFEGMPNALMEAMSVGLPCISTDCGGGGAAALASYDGGCILVPVGDVISLTNAMTSVADDNNYRNVISEQASKINERLAVEEIIKLWQAYLQKIAH